MIISRRLITVLALVLTVPYSLFGQARGMKTAIEQPSDTRIALVIGNGAYQASPLRNPANDARAVTQALEKTGFTMEPGRTLSRTQGSTL
jgi:hypothetical protein